MKKEKLACTINNLAQDIYFTSGMLQNADGISETVFNSLLVADIGDSRCVLQAKLHLLHIAAESISNVDPKIMQKLAELDQAELTDAKSSVLPIAPSY